MNLQFCGAARTVTGSCYYIENGDTKILVDCGAFQGSKDLSDQNYEPFPFNPSEIDYVFLTHSHYDHCGRLPILYKNGFTGKIICTKPTRDLAEIILLDSAHIQKEDYRRYKQRSNQLNSNWVVRPPLYTQDEVIQTMGLFEVHPYGKSIELSDNLEFRMRDAGHILGSSIFELWIKFEDSENKGRSRKFVFSGDLGQPGQRIVKDPDMLRDADYVIVESTYGNRLHKNKDDTVIELFSVLNSAAETKSNVIIPTFAVERAQEILYEMNSFYEKELLINFPVYLDSPMAIKATNVFKQYPSFYDEDAERLLNKNDDPFNFPGLQFTPDTEQSKKLIELRGGVIMAGSGMCTGGRVLHHLKNNIENESAHIMFVGYQVKGTLGRDIVDKHKKVRIFGQNYTVKAKVHTLGGFSAHADERDLRYWLRGFGNSTRAVYITHGSEDVAIAFSGKINNELRLNTEVPKMLEKVEIF